MSAPRHSVRVTFRTIPASFDVTAVARIDAALRGIVADHGVRLLHAIESGSRAWGFPSPDSDYDCRFLFARPREAYLSLWPPRDVIELPLVGDMDVNGWDLAKALKLMLKGNAVVLEWLTSPVVYASDPAARDALLAFAGRHADRAAIARHYLHLGERQRRVYLDVGTSVALKKLFYALRPAAALRWLWMHPGQAVAPMHFPTLMAQCDPPGDVAAIVFDLIARKAVTRELGRAAMPAAIAGFIDAEFETARRALDGQAALVSDAAMAEADALFLKLVG